MSDKTKKAETETTETQEAPSTTLLSSISYTNQEDYEKFLANLSPEHAVIVLIAAANHCQARGMFTLDESELIAKSIRKLSVQPQTEQSSTPQEN